MGRNNSQSETELSAAEEEDLRHQAESDEPLDTTVEDEQDPDDDQPIDETQRAEEKAGEQRQKVKTVPHQALHEERERRKASEANFNTLLERNSRLESRFQQLLDRFTREDQQQEQEQIPDRETQPFEYMAWQDQRIQRLEQAWNGQQRQSQESSQLNSALNYGNQLAGQFRSEVGPEEYDAAYQFVYGQRYQELKEMNYPEHQIPSILQQEVQGGILAALKNGVNPGQVLYNLAKQRGYQSKTPQQRLDNKGEAQARAKSLGGGAEKKLVTAGSVEDIARMSDEDFEKFVSSKEGRAKFKRAFIGN